MDNKSPLKLYKHLSFSNFKSLNFWDYYTLSVKSQVLSNYELIPLSKVIKQRKHVTIIEDKKEYMRCRVQLYGKGILLRDKASGKTIKTKKQQICLEDDFLVAEIDAKFGGYGIVPEELEGAIVSGHYFLFEINKCLLMPDFLSKLVKCEGFSKQVKATGSTNYAAIRPYHVLDYLIPLPSIKIQNRITEIYNQKTQLAERQEQEAIQLEKKFEDYLFDVLGIEQLEDADNKQGLQFTNFKDLERWDVFVNQQSYTSFKYGNKRLKSIVNGKPVYGANVKGIKKVSDTRYIRITDINENGTLNNGFVSPAKVDEKYLLQNNDFLIARSGNTVGKTFLYKAFIGRAIFAGYLVKYDLDTEQVFPEYLLLLTKSFIFKKWIESNMRVAGQPNINGQEFLQAPIILPSLTIQMEIANTVGKMKSGIKVLQEQAVENRKLAIEEFEAEIFQ